MSAAATAAAVVAVQAATFAFGLLLGIWLPMLTALALTMFLLVDEARRGWRRWRATRKWAARLSA